MTTATSMVGDDANFSLSVIIPHYNDLANLAICLGHLDGQTIRRDVEILVIDNGSSVPFPKIGAITAGRAKLLICAEKGAGPARNVGIAHARSDRFAFLDSDCRADPDWLRAGMAALERFDLVGGQVRVLVDRTGPITDVEAFELVFAFNNERYVAEEGFSVTANLFCRRGVADAIGGFRAGVSEDTDWCHRARDHGFRLGYDPAAAVGHPARRTWDQLLGKWRRMIRENYLLAATRPGGAFRFVLRSWAVLLSIVPHSILVLRTPRLTGWRERMGALRVLVGLRAFRFAVAHRIAWDTWRKS